MIGTEHSSLQIEEVSLHTFINFAYATFFARIAQ